MTDGSALKNRPTRALVTGGSKRIGRAICERLAMAGLEVVVHFNQSSETADDMAKALSDYYGVRTAALGAQLMDEEETRGLVQRAHDILGPIDVLVNNASVFEADSIETANRQSWDRHLITNLYAPFALSQEFMRQLPEGVLGNIVNIVDQRVLNPTPHFTSYTVSKLGLWSMTKTLAQALAPQVRVNAVGPGPTLPSPRQTAEQFEEQWRSVPLERQVMPEEIAAAVGFILDAPSMTGQTIVLDGGEHLGWVKGSKIAPEE